MMDLETFEDLLDRHGGDLARWPEPMRTAARAVVAASAEARAMLDAMAEVEAILRRDRRTAERADMDRVAVRAMRRPQETRGRRLAAWTGWGTAAAAMLVLGLLVGGLAPTSANVVADRTLAASLEPIDVTDVD